MATQGPRVLCRNGSRGDPLEFLAGLLMAFAIGAFCRWFDIPSPAPPKLVGALLVVAMTMGFLLTERLIGVR